MRMLLNPGRTGRYRTDGFGGFVCRSLMLTVRGRPTPCDVAGKLTAMAEITAVPYRTMREYNGRPGELGLLMGKGLAESRKAVCPRRPWATSPPSTTRLSSMACCSTRRPKTCSPSPPTDAISARVSPVPLSIRVNRVPVLTVVRLALKAVAVLEDGAG
jgi:hypothetical protein